MSLACSGGKRGMRDLLFRFKRVIPAVIPFVFFSQSPAVATQYHIRPDGLASGNGSSSSPWNLETALSHPAVVVPGDTLWLHGGVYRGAYECFLEGDSECADHCAVVSGRSGRSSITAARTVTRMWVKGTYTWFWGFEIMVVDTESPP